MADPHAAGKRAAGRAAAEHVEGGMHVGLGTGSTFVFVLERLAERVAADGLELVGYPTSRATEALAREHGLRVGSLDAVDRLDLAIDGADEVDPAGNLIKGGGGALVREKIIAAAAPELVVVVSANKLVDRLGATFRLPVEVLPFGCRQVGLALAELGLTPELRRATDGATVVTDNGNWILDCAMPADGTRTPAELERCINAIPGVLDNGLFVGMTGPVIVGHADGRVTTRTPS